MEKGTLTILVQYWCSYLRACRSADQIKGYLFTNKGRAGIRDYPASERTGVQLDPLLDIMFMSTHHFRGGALLKLIALKMLNHPQKGRHIRKLTLIPNESTSLWEPCTSEHKEAQNLSPGFLLQSQDVQNTPCRCWLFQGYPFVAGLKEKQERNIQIAKITGFVMSFGGTLQGGFKGQGPRSPGL